MCDSVLFFVDKKIVTISNPPPDPTTRRELATVWQRIRMTRTRRETQKEETNETETKRRKKKEYGSSRVVC